MIHASYRMDFKYLSRLAVPAFFMISGCFCYCPRKENENEEEFQARKLKRAKQKILAMLKYLLFGYLFYYLFDVIYAFSTGGNPSDVFKGFYSDHLFVDIFIYNHVSNSGGQMWFLLALFAVSCLHYAIVRFKIEKAYFFLPSLIVIFFLFAVWTYKFNGRVVWGEKSRNALFLALPCFAMGFDVHYLLHRFSPKKKIWQIALALLFLALAASTFYLQIEEQKWLGTDAEMYIASWCSASCFIAFFLLCPSPNPKYYELVFGKSLAFYAFIYHGAVNKVLSYLKWSGIGKTYAVFGISLALAVLTHWLFSLCGYLYRLSKKKRGDKKIDWSLS